MRDSETAGAGYDCGPWAGPPARKYLLTIPVTVLANTLIAVFLWVLLGGAFSSFLVYSQAVGCSILILHWGIACVDRTRRLPEWVATAIAVPSGGALGFLGAASFVGGPGPELLHDLTISAAAGLVFGPALSHYFVTRARLHRGEARLREELLAREEAARRLAEAELKLLQAQIEPHFLFNTLSNVLQLVDSDPQRARRMLLNLTSYLRGSLGRTRTGATTLGEELELVRAYLEIQAVRMGPRLRWTIGCPDELRGATLPPLLVQPLVENAVRHAIDPRPDGGEVVISASGEGADLVVEVRDDGPGLDPRQPVGVGLTNVRERVRAVSGGRGSLTLRALGAGGLCARVQLPRAPRTAPSSSAGGSS